MSSCGLILAPGPLPRPARVRLSRARRGGQWLPGDVLTATIDLDCCEVAPLPARTRNTLITAHERQSPRLQPANASIPTTRLAACTPAPTPQPPTRPHFTSTASHWARRARCCRHARARCSTRPPRSRTRRRACPAPLSPRVLPRALFGAPTPSTPPLLHMSCFPRPIRAQASEQTHAMRAERARPPRASRAHPGAGSARAPGARAGRDGEPRAAPAALWAPVGRVAAFPRAVSRRASHRALPRRVDRARARPAPCAPPPCRS
jgi:hypothetical protein